ncbi:MAG: LemA family protein [Deltaproteobacteria bacterium]|nr:LemA family protein [Deltaproteobacteria bacterium]
MSASIAFVAILLALVLYAIAVYNALIRGKNEVRNAWRQIDVQLNRRHDLIPNLVETVKRYAAHERETLDAVVRARQQAVSSQGSVEQRVEAENALTRSLRSLFAVVEAFSPTNALPFHPNGERGQG